jgi:hypothetical protein
MIVRSTFTFVAASAMLLGGVVALEPIFIGLGVVGVGLAAVGFRIGLKQLRVRSPAEQARSKALRHFFERKLAEQDERD